MLGLLRAEWMKITHQGTTRLVALFFLGLALLVLCLRIWYTLAPVSLEQRQANYEELSFPNAAIQGAKIIEHVGIYLVPIFFASLVGSEYGLDTWKNLLIRQPGRLRFIAVKLAVAIPAILLILIGTLAIAQLFGSAAGFVVSDTATKAGLHSVAYSRSIGQDLIEEALLLLPYYAVAATLATLFAVVGHSTVAGIVATVVWVIGDQVLPLFLPDFKDFSVSLNSVSLGQNFASGNGPFTTQHSLLLIGAYIAIPVVLSMVIFRRRDIAGQ